MIKKLIEKITNLLLAKQLLKQKQLNDSFNNNVQLLNTTFKTQRKSHIARGKKWIMKVY